MLNFNKALRANNTKLDILNALNLIDIINVLENGNPESLSEHYLVSLQGLRKLAQNFFFLANLKDLSHYFIYLLREYESNNHSGIIRQKDFNQIIRSHLRRASTEHQNKKIKDNIEQLFKSAYSVAFKQENRWVFKLTPTERAQLKAHICKPQATDLYAGETNQTPVAAADYITKENEIPLDKPCTKLIALPVQESSASENNSSELVEAVIAIPVKIMVLSSVPDDDVILNITSPDTPLFLSQPEKLNPLAKTKQIHNKIFRESFDNDNLLRDHTQLSDSELIAFKKNFLINLSISSASLTDTQRVELAKYILSEKNHPLARERDYAPKLGCYSLFWSGRSSEHSHETKSIHQAMEILLAGISDQTLFDFEKEKTGKVHRQAISFKPGLSTIHAQQEVQQYTFTRHGLSLR